MNFWQDSMRSPSLITGPVRVGVGVLASFQNELFRTSAKARTVLEYTQLKNRWALDSSCVLHGKQVVWVCIPHFLSPWNGVRCFHLLLQSIMEILVGMWGPDPCSYGVIGVLLAPLLSLIVSDMAPRFLNEEPAH